MGWLYHCKFVCYWDSTCYMKASFHIIATIAMIVAIAVIAMIAEIELKSISVIVAAAIAVEWFPYDRYDR